MKTLQLNVPEELVARVDRALKREGLDVHEVTLGGAWDSRAVYRDKRTTLHVVPGTPLPDVPRVIAFDGPRMPQLGRTSVKRADEVVPVELQKRIARA